MGGGRLVQKKLCHIFSLRFRWNICSSCFVYHCIGNEAISEHLQLMAMRSNHPELSMFAAIVSDFGMDFMFFLIILGATDEKARRALQVLQ